MRRSPGRGGGDCCGDRVGRLRRRECRTPCESMTAMSATAWLDVEAPDVANRELAGFWEGTSRRQLLAQSCRNCGSFRWPPRGICGACRSLDSTWVPVGSSGLLFTWTVVWHTNLAVFRDNTPYAVGIVELDAAPVRMVGHLEMPPDDLV